MSSIYRPGCGPKVSNKKQFKKTDRRLDVAQEVNTWAFNLQCGYWDNWYEWAESSSDEGDNFETEVPDADG